MPYIPTPLQPVSMLPLILGSLFALGGLITAFFTLRRKRLIDDLPTSKTQGVFIGLTELKGTAESENPLTSFLAGISCVQYDWQVQEQWSRTVHETYHDAQGHMHTRTRQESGWTTVASGSQADPFYLKDDTGILRIVPQGARIHSVTTFTQTFTPDNPLYYGKAPVREIANTTHRRRFVETAIPLHAQLYIVGQARERQDIVAAEVATDKNCPMFLISTRTERQLSGSYSRWFWFWLGLGMLLAIAGAFFWNLLMQPVFMFIWPPYASAVAGYLLAWLLGGIWAIFNSLVHLRQRVRQAWSQVDIQLKRRYDLITNLVQTVEGYRGHESGVQQLVAELRGQMTATPPGMTGVDFKGIAPVLRATVESYPDLKASESFLRLQQALTETEQRIALARGYFNDSATFYNTRLEIIPDRFVAALTGFRQQALMSAADFERAPVQVNLKS